uniref:Endoplasmic reticulum transmembrane protein n=1 Tax=Heterorhabditis bacteriophora TaxID=37862 RepID=A0A1I7WEK8_HETBA
MSVNSLVDVTMGLSNMAGSPIHIFNFHMNIRLRNILLQIKYRFAIMVGAISFLILIAVEEAVRRQALTERQQMLNDAALLPELS